MTNSSRQEHRRLLKLSFLRLQEWANLQLPIYVRPRIGEEERPSEQFFSAGLPVEMGSGEPLDYGSSGEDVDYQSYWVTFTEVDTCQKKYIFPKDNHRVFERILHFFLQQKLQSHQDLSSKSLRMVYDKHLRSTIIMDEFPEGFQTIWLEPYFHRALNSFGYLTDFKFEMKPEVQFNKRVQQLSLSLDRHGNENRDFYIDRLHFIRLFLRDYVQNDRLFPIETEAGTIEIDHQLIEQRYSLLDTKKYLFAADKTHKSQYGGLSKLGPHKRIDFNAYFHFIFLDEDREYARDLFKALRGDYKRKVVFNGMASVFGINFENSQIHNSVLESYSVENVGTAIQGFAEEELKNSVFIILARDFDENYYELKHYFASRGLVSQVVRTDLISRPETFKWSVGNIALQLFAKLGGTPWRVKPSHDDTLIVGLGQAHDFEENELGERSIRKFSAFSVLTDASGIFQDIQTLAQSEERGSYLSQLRVAIEKLISEHRNDFRRIVVHAPYKVRRSELEAIKEAITGSEEEGSDIEFVMLKINAKNKYFAYNPNANSYVPFESSYTQLSHSQFLIWFEGLQYHNPKISRRIPGPTHIEFYYSSQQLSREQKKDHLQDVLNLSGANWRGFNAKNLPVSVYYCQIIATFIKEFRSRGLPPISIDNIKPWFL